MPLNYENNENFLSEFAFHDLSARASLFRSRLLEEFQILDNIAQSNNVQAPQYSSKDVKDPKTLKRLLLENPFQLIKFQQLKRKLKTQERKKDRRLTRVKNINSLPIGAWAAWVHECKQILSLVATQFQRLILLLIIISSIFSGVSAELKDNEKNYWQLFQAISYFDLFSLFVFILEIILKWLDDFNAYWQDGWNIFDFSLTILSALPNLLDLLSAGTATNSKSLGIFQQVRAFRVLRTLKIVVKFGNLKLIVLTIIEAFRSLVVILLLIIVVAYIYAIIGVNLFAAYTKYEGANPSYKNDFQNIGLSMLTMFQLLTFDQWDEISTDMRPVVSPAVIYIFFISWIWLGAFIFRNIFVGVMVTDFQNIREKMNEQKSEYMKQKKFERMRKKLNRELETRRNIQKSFDNLKQKTSESTQEPTPPPPPDDILGSEAPPAEPLMETILEEPVEKEGQKVSFSQEFSVNQSKEKMHSQSSFPSNHFEITEADWAHVEALKLGLGWDKTVEETMQGLGTTKESTSWPRDTLFKYLQLMENLQENMREFEELQMAASSTLLSLHDE